MIRPCLKYKSGSQLWGANAGGAFGIGKTPSACYSDWARQMRVASATVNANPQWFTERTKAYNLDKVHKMLDEATLTNLIIAFARMKNGM